MSVYSAIFGQSIWDVCLQTYGTIDMINQLLSDNDIDIDVEITTGMEFTWDDTLTTDQYVNQKLSETSIIYATKSLANGNTLSVVKNESSGSAINTNGTYYQPIKENEKVKYQSTAEVQYIAAGGETTVILSELIGATIVQITREQQPLKTSDYQFNSSNGQITINELYANETLYIIYGKIITT